MNRLHPTTKPTLLRCAVWVAVLLALVSVAAWHWHWQAACWLAVGWAAIAMAWHLVHLQSLLTALQQPPTHTLPTALGLWGEVFYYLHRLSRQHALEVADLNAQQTRFTQAMQASPNAFVMLDDAGRVAWLNAAAQAMLGLDPLRDTGQNLAYLLRTPAVAALLGSTRNTEPITLQTQGKTIAVQAFAFGDQQTLLLGQDLTALERTERVRRDFVANVSHELRTPLTVFTGYAELLHDQVAQLPPALQEATAHLLSQTQRMNQLTQDLLQLATLEAGGDAHAEQLLAAPVAAVSQWLDWALRSHAPLAQAAGVALRVIPPLADTTSISIKPSNTHSTHSELLVRGEWHDLHSALGNLVSNAIRYTAAGGSVSVQAQAVQGCCHIAVCDTGCGIAVEHLPRLTERFYRVSASRSREQGGTGLGLAIVKHLMQKLGGKLRIHSEIGVGSTFTLVLPLAQPLALLKLD